MIITLHPGLTGFTDPMQHSTITLRSLQILTGTTGGHFRGESASTAADMVIITDTILISAAPGTGVTILSIIITGTHGTDR